MDNQGVEALRRRLDEKEKERIMAWSIIESLRAIGDAAHQGTEAAFAGQVPGLYKIPDCPISRNVVENSKRDGFEIDRENLQGDMGQIGLYFRNAVEQLGLDG